MKYQTILFDFDYTLGDSTGPIVACCTAALTGMGFPAPEQKAVQTTIGYTLQDGYTLLTGDKDEGRREEFYCRFRAKALEIMARDTGLCPGAGELLRALKAAGIPAGIVSTKSKDMLEDIFARQGLRETLDVILGFQDVRKAKPDPEGLRAAMERVGAGRDRTLYCGDTVIDAQAAQNAGVDFCAVLNGVTPAEAFAPYPCVHIAPDLADLRVWLGVSS